ncbi:hypothetical protein [Flavobacterium sp.]|uniref:hypothetical protein n=1 Tax=Flavobacterium sp. TaxID=239 RepID=UPI003BBB95F0
MTNIGKYSKINFSILCSVVNNGSFGFAEGCDLRVGTKANVPLVRLAKIVLKKCMAKKSKNKLLAISVSLISVRLQFEINIFI